MTTVYDTEVEKGSPPVEIAKIDPRSQVVRIGNLRVMSEFLNKRNINTAAVNQIDLLFKRTEKTLATHPINKAKSILDLVAVDGYAVELCSQGTKYAVIVPGKEGPRLIITDTKVLHDLLIINNTNIESIVLRAMVNQIPPDYLKTALDECAKDDPKEFADLCKELLKPSGPDDSFSHQLG